MQLFKPRLDIQKGWFFGVWNSDLDISVGYANEGVDERHYHHKMSEIYLIARGNAVMQVDDRIVELEAGDAIIITPGETHTFLSSSPDYFHFVIQTPGLKAEEARADKIVQSR